MNLKTLILTTLLTATIPAAAVPQQRVGLVLSGGGAKGIAHAGVIQALEENDIAIDYVAGTSMGAIVGGLYSCGYSPEEMMELFTSPVLVCLHRTDQPRHGLLFFRSHTFARTVHAIARQ